ncbi:MAG: hypothetical protein IJF37_09735 [Lachnospiraceae bacterium]|nr:hypothetical protein [Lachnospiraceae bacterium]
MKTKLGISTCMTAGLVFLLAIVTTFVSSSWVYAMPFVLLVAYVLYKEEDLWLKASALKAVFLVIFLVLVSFLFGFVYDLLDFINFFLQFADINIVDGFGIISFFTNIIDVIGKIFLLILAISAFKGKTVKLPLIDNMINKHLS